MVALTVFLISFATANVLSPLSSCGFVAAIRATEALASAVVAANKSSLKRIIYYIKSPHLVWELFYLFSFNLCILVHRRGVTTATEEAKIL